ncbi:hypothetical protein ACJQWK_06419 [Exserohilum turcicum]
MDILCVGIHKETYMLDYKQCEAQLQDVPVPPSPSLIQHPKFRQAVMHMCGMATIPLQADSLFSPGNPHTHQAHADTQLSAANLRRDLDCQVMRISHLISSHLTL